MLEFDKLILASNNKGKIAEIKNMLDVYGVEVFSSEELGLLDVEETGTTFEENAKLKAETLCKLTELPCLADDSGLCVRTLNDAPGVYTARYAPNRDFRKGMEKLLSEIEAAKSDDRSASFVCLLALARPGQATEVFEGRVDGNIAKEISGENGFGYDPIFVPEGYDKTFGHFSKEDKAKISHRGRALEKFVKRFFGA